MPLDFQLVEKPIKYASIATIIFVVSAFILGNAYEYLSLASLDLPQSATWNNVESIADLSVQKSIRYFAFYFISFLVFSCYESSAPKSLPWGILSLFAIFPAFMSFTPFLISGVFSASPLWAMTAMLMSLLYIGVGYKHPSKWLRWIFSFLILFIVWLQINSELEAWKDAIRPEAEKLFGSGYSYDQYMHKSLLWFAPVGIISVGVHLYLISWLPRKFFSEMKISET